MTSTEQYKDQFKFIMYLDMDGVLTSGNYIIKMHDCFVGKQDDENKDFRYRNFMHQWCFQTEAVDCLNKLYDLAPYTIILSSTRRFQLTPTEWNTIFRINDIKAYVGGRTGKVPKDNYISWREDEIKQYHYNMGSMFTFNKIPFIVVDDDCFDLMELEDRLIKVDTDKGLTLEHLDDMVNKLKIQGVKFNDNTRSN